MSRKGYSLSADVWRLKGFLLNIDAMKSRSVVRCSLACLLLTVGLGIDLYAQIQAKLPVVEAVSGTRVTLPLVVGALTGQNITAFEFVVSCDTNIVLLDSVDQRGTLSEGLMMFANNRVAPFNKGRMKVVCAGAYPLKGAGPLVKILASVKRKEGVSSLRLSEFVLNAGQPKVQSISGTLTSLRKSTSKGKAKQIVVPGSKTSNNDQ